MILQNFAVQSDKLNGCDSWAEIFEKEEKTAPYSMSIWMVWQNPKQGNESIRSRSSMLNEKNRIYDWNYWTSLKLEQNLFI